MTTPKTIKINENLFNIKDKQKKETTKEKSKEDLINRLINKIKENKNSQTQKKSKPDPPWGCLRRGKKPTYKQYYNRKVNPKPNIIIESPPVSLSNQFIERNNVLRKKKKLILGKHKSSVSVLIKGSNYKTKKRSDVSTVKNKTMRNIKKILRKRGLIRRGTRAPDDLLKHIYVNSECSGDIENNKRFEVEDIIDSSIKEIVENEGDREKKEEASDNESKVIDSQDSSEKKIIINK